MSDSHATKRYINLMSVIVLIPCLLLVTGNTVFAENYLQLDADPATYVYGPVFGEPESIVTTDSEFTLYALVDSTKGSITDTFYLSAAIIPSIQPEPSTPPTLGSFTFSNDGPPDTINVVGDMTYGTPPILVLSNSDDLPGHGVFETYYWEYAFTLDGIKRANLYDSQTAQGALVDNPDGLLYYEDFSVNVSGLSGDYAVHFDLYTTTMKDGVLVLGDKAPFSHDVTTTPVPGAVLLGMIVLGVVGVNLRKYA